LIHPVFDSSDAAGVVMEKGQKLAGEPTQLGDVPALGLAYDSYITG
jgi:hypothetical protein